MAQLFPPSSNSTVRALIIGGVLAAAGLISFPYLIDRSPYVSGQRVSYEQPVPFSHMHHVRGLGIDCRYCHTGVENSPFAGIPATKTCMTCHSQIWTNADLLEPVRAAFKDNKPIQWTRVHNLPHYVFFDHSIHINKGVACTTCHGPVQFMPLTYQQNTLHMRWCIDCHRHPERFIGRREDVFKTDSNHPDRDDLFMTNLHPLEKEGVEPEKKLSGAELVKLYKIKPRVKMQDCYTCHR